MIKVGQRVTLPVLREVGAGSMLDAQNLGEILMPVSERVTNARDEVDVFIYRDSDDQPVATERRPLALPGTFAALKVLASNNTGAFLDWGLGKDLLLPFSEQRSLPKVGKPVVVYVHVDPKSDRLVASQRINKHFSQDYPPYQAGDQVDLLLFGKTEMGYKAIVGGKFSGLIFKNQVFEDLFYADRLTGYVSEVRRDGKIDLTLHAPGIAKIEKLEDRLLHELEMRGGFWDLTDKAPSEVIHAELGVSKKVFKKALGALYRKRLISIESNGIRRSS